MRSNPALDTLTARRARWIKAQKAALHGPSVAAILRRVLRILVPTLLLLIWAVGVFVRVFVQDRARSTPSYFFYATPPAVLAALVFGAALWWHVARLRALVIPSAALGVACLLWAYRVTWMHNPPVTPVGATQRVLFWNVAHGSFGWPRVIREIRRHNPDIIGLVEAGDEITVAGLTKPETMALRMAEAERMRAFFLREFPEYTPHVSPYNLALLTRGSPVQVTEDTLDGNEYVAFGHYFDATIHTADDDLHVVLVDINLDFNRSLWPPLTRLREVLKRVADQPVLVIGDFNTPADALAVWQLRDPFVNAFETAGNGYAATWPVPVPLLAIDQAWYNAGVQVSRCTLGWTWASDHRCIELDIALVPKVR